MMGPSLIQSGGGGSVAPGTAVRERVVLYDELTTSGTWSKSDVLARPQFSGLRAQDVVVTMIAIGGGAGGRSGASTYGGLPGGCAWRTLQMADLPDTMPYTIGAGGPSATPGGNTVFGDQDGGAGLLLGQGAQTGSTLSAIQDAHFFCSLRSMTRVPDVTRHTSSIMRPNSPDGPGGGGNNGSGAVTVGGIGSTAFGSTDATRPAYTASETAEAGKAGRPWSFGAGGAGNASGAGTAGAFPGGGGGAGSTSGGPGGAGCVRLVYTVAEIA